MAEEKPEQQQTQPTALVQWEPQSATEAWQLAKYYGGSDLIPKALRNTADVFVTIAAGRDFGWSPMQSMRGIYVVEGKPSLSADAMVGIAKTSKVCKFFRLVESTAKIATYETLREGDPSPVRMSFTIEEANAAGLLNKKGPWQSYPARMLRNRCKSALCKEVYEELFFGTYEESEAEEIPARIGGRRAPPAAVQDAPAPRNTERELNAPPAAKESTPATEASTVAHDPETGEIREPEVQHTEASPADAFRERIAAAASVPDLANLAAEMKQAAERGILTATDRAALLDAYNARRKVVLVPVAA